MTAVRSTDSTHLPVADAAGVRRAAWRLIGRERGAFVRILVLNVLATAVGLVGPWLLGLIIDDVQAAAGGSGGAAGGSNAATVGAVGGGAVGVTGGSGGTGAHVVGGGSGGTVAHLVGRIDRLALLILVSALIQLFLTRHARHLAARFGQRLSAHVREQFLDGVLGLRAADVERADIGDLTARGSGDVDAVATIMRDAAPDVLIAAMQAVLVVVAVFLVDPLLGACGVLGLAGIVVAARWYLRRARSAYLELGAANSTLAEVLVSTVQGARTVELLGLRHRRIEASAAAIERGRRSRLRALMLRSVLYPVIDVSYVLPFAGVLLAGGALYVHDMISLGAVVSSVLYLRQLSGPLETMQIWIDALQSGAASFARLEGLRELPTTQAVDTEADADPADDRIVVRGVHFGYDAGRDVLHGVDLEIRAGERLAIVGPSGAGKSTLGRLLAGIDAPRVGSVTVGGVPVVELRPEQLRRHIVLVTQDLHVFHASVRDNLRIAKPTASDAELHAALLAVGAEAWADALPDGLDTDVSPAGHKLDGSQAQQLALARVVLADPHTVILDEATALLDPTTARATERALSAVLKGRTVLAIAHRLHTAHDADRVAVMADGRLTELGTHDELAAQGGTYAGLWSSWHGDTARETAA